MLKAHFLPVAATLVTFFMLSTTSGAAESTENMRDFGTVSCKDIMRMSGEERDLALAFAHGYMLGKKDTTQYNVDALAQITDQFVDYCLDHPAENALQSFEKFAK